MSHETALPSFCDDLLHLELSGQQVQQPVLTNHNIGGNGKILAFSILQFNCVVNYENCEWPEADAPCPRHCAASSARGLSEV